MQTDTLWIVKNDSLIENSDFQFNFKKLVVHFLYHFKTWLLNRWKNKIITLLPSEEINNLHHALPTVLKLAVFKLQNFFLIFHVFSWTNYFSISYGESCDIGTIGEILAKYQCANTYLSTTVSETIQHESCCTIQSNSSDSQCVVILGWFWPPTLKYKSTIKFKCRTLTERIPSRENRMGCLSRE